MSRPWKWTLAALIAGLLFAAPLTAQDGDSWTEQALQGSEYSLTSVAVESDAQGRPVITLAADSAVEYESFVLDGPDRLVLDLAGVVSRLDNYRYDVDRGGVAQVRAAQHELNPTPITRVVFDLEGPIPYHIDRSGGGIQVTFGDAVESTTASHEATPAVPTPTPTPAIVAEPEPVQPVVTEVAVADEIETPSRAIEPAEIEALLNAPALAAPAPEPQESTPAQSAGAFETRRLVSATPAYTGKRVSLNLVDADLKQVFRLFHEISGLNFVLDPSVTGRVTIVLDQVPWDQALDLILKNNGLDKVLEGNVLRIAKTSKLAQEASARKQLKEAEELEVEPITVTRTLSYAKAVDVQSVIREGGILSSRGRVIVDERTNTLIISDVPKRVAPLDALIDTLDAETPQVMIEARIVETSRNYVQDLGVNWGFSALADASRGTATGLNFPHNASASYGLNLPLDGAANTLAFSFGNIIDSFTLDLALAALETEGEGRILSSPKIVTENNRRAEIEQGVRIPIVNTTATEINVEFVSASLRLAVTPQITAEGTVSLDIIVENNSPDFVNTAGDIPSIRTQRAQTKVLINDGGTTVIGGIFTVNEGRSEVGVPWFRKIPIFGWLFRSQNITNENRELLIFITPKIVKLN